MYTMKSRQIPVNDCYDVIVVGGGPSGCTAAAAAAREGAKALLIEATGCLGGMGTQGLVPCWCPFSDKEKIIYRGLAEKVFSRSKEEMYRVNPEDMDWVPINAEHLKQVYDDLVTEAGADILFNTVLSAVETEEPGMVSAIITSNKKGLTAYKAKVYVDCTGDADLAVWAGAAYEKGDEENGELMPATHCFILGNIKEEAYAKGTRLHPHFPDSPIFDIVKSGKFPLIADVHVNDVIVAPGTLGFNAGHIWEVDNTEPESVSKALLQGRKMAKEFLKALKEYYPEVFSDAYLAATAPLMGIREGRRITGSYTLTLKDYLERRSFEDEICRNSYYIDIHNSIREKELANDRSFDSDQRYGSYEKGESHGIPYRCLTPKDLKNVLVAGRSISCERIVQGSVRVMPVCLAMGEAAGMAAVHSMRLPEVDIHSIDVQYLRKRLREEGAYLPS